MPEVFSLVWAVHRPPARKTMVRDPRSQRVNRATPKFPFLFQRLRIDKYGPLRNASRPSNTSDFLQIEQRPSLIPEGYHEFLRSLKERIRTAQVRAALAVIESLFSCRIGGSVRTFSNGN